MPRIRACRFSAASPSSPPSAASNAVDDVLDRDLAEVGAEVLGEPAARRRACPRRSSETASRRSGARSGPSACAQSAAVTAESIPPETPTTTSPRAVLADVVAQAEDERAAASARARARTGSIAPDAPRSCRRSLPSSTTGTSGSGSRSLGERAPAHVAQAPPDRGGRVDVDDEQRLLEAGRAGDHLALVVEHDRVAVEDQLVLPADRVAEGEETAVVAGARDEHLLAVLGLADVVRRGGEVDDQLGAGEREVGGGRPGLPDVLADRRPDQRLAELQEHEVAAGGEVAVLVEDAVVGQEPLAVDGRDPAAGADRARVREVAVEPGHADEGDDVGAGGRDRPRSARVPRARSPARSSRSSGG